MKFLKLGIVSAFLIVAIFGAVFVLNRPVVQPVEATFTEISYPDPSAPACVEGQLNVQDNQKFSKKIGLINFAFRWHITSQDSSTVTYQLQVDINATQNETWVNELLGKKLPTKVFELPNCNPNPCDEQVEAAPTKDMLLDEIVNPCEEPTPTPTPEDPGQPGNPPTFAGSSTNPPVCTEGNTLQLPANLHVLRTGSKAVVNFFITEGDSANIYWRVVGQSNWQNAVANVKPNGDKFVSFEINELDPNLGYDFGVQQKQGCGGGQLLTAVVVDGPATQTFSLSYWEWSK